MKSHPNDPAAQPQAAPLKRRGMLIGAGATAAAGAVAALAARTGPDAPAAPVKQARAAEGEGYRLTDHVRRYYETIRT